MKKGLLGAALLFVGVMILASCSTTSGGGGGTIYVLGAFSTPLVWLTDGGPNFDNPFNPVTGNDISNAAIVASNETTGAFSILTWITPAQSEAPNGHYESPSGLSHGTGESVSLRIVTADETITGGPTTTPDTSSYIVTPAPGITTSLPLTVTWEVVNQNSNATHCWFSIFGADANNEDDGHQEVLPISTKSYTVTSAHITQTGNYDISVTPVNVMSFTGAKTGSVAYVGTLGNTMDRSVLIQ
jgi:hypothetical protein